MAKTHKNIIRQYIVISLLVIQQITGLVHIATMPRFKDIDYRQQSSSVDFLHKNHNSNLPRVPFQRSFHTVDESSRKSLTAPSKFLTLFYVFLLSALIASLLLKKDEGYFSTSRSFSSLSYLSLRSLRI